MILMRLTCDQIFGTPSELVEMFDMAHVLIFLIMVLFVSMIGLILWRFHGFCEVRGCRVRCLKIDFGFLTWVWSHSVIACSRVCAL